MNKIKILEPDLDNLLKRTLKNDLPVEIEARMSKQFLRFKRTLDRPESPASADEWTWRGLFRKEILTFVSAAMIIVGLVMQLSGSQTALAHSIGQLKAIITVSMSLKRTAFMDCTIIKPEAAGEDASYHVLWRANGDARVDMVSAGGAQTIWIADETISFADSDGGSIRSMPLKTIAPGPVWQPALEFRTPRLFAKHMEEQYGLMQTGERRSAGSGEFLIVGREDGQAIEIAVDANTYLPKVLKKYALESGRTDGDRICLMEVRFHWNQPIRDELFVPGPLSGKQ